jgi:pSer/pThr/pTyr-binding forkhead associated (FHA) protein
MRMGTGSHVRIVVDHEVVREVVLRPPMTFGRSKDNDVVLDDEAVSAKHGRVEHGAHGWRYVDCHSANGTLMAGGPHLGPGETTDLEPDTQLKLGDTILDFRLVEEPAQHEAPGEDDSLALTDPINPGALDPRLMVVTTSRVTTHPLPMPHATIGRSQDNDVVLEHGSVSSNHAEISWTGHGWEVRDLGSTNGTRVGLIPVTEARPLVNAAHLIVGEVDLLFLHAGEEGSIAATELVRSLRRRGGLSAGAARKALDEHARSGRSVEEILVERRLLTPGSLYEMRHDAMHTTVRQPGPREPGALTWWLMAAALAAIVWLLVR